MDHVTSEWTAIGVALAAGAGIIIAVIAEAYLRETADRLEWLESEIERLERLVGNRKGAS